MTPVQFHGTTRINEHGHLEIGGCDTVELVRQFGSPLYVLDEELLRENARRWRRAAEACSPRAAVYFASKALANLAIARIMDQEGLGLDVVSAGELYTALAAEFPPRRIIFHGNNKSDEELEMAVRAGVGRIIVDGEAELERLEHIAGRLRRKAKILLRITPGIEAHTHDYIRTGQIDSKFGIPFDRAVDAAARALALDQVSLVGLHCHIGSQIFDVAPIGDAARIMIDLMAAVRERTGAWLQELNVGGGLGIRYVAGDDPPPVAEWVEAAHAAAHRRCTELGLPTPGLAFEPGRSIVGDAGTTLYTVGAVKEIPGVRRYVAVDGGMADNPRPALYRARYEAVNASRASSAPGDVFSVAGKCCESGDMLIWDWPLADPRPGDVLAVFATGAYNYSMASNYNRLCRPAMVLVARGRADLIVRRETYEDIISCDVLPASLQARRAANS